MSISLAELCQVCQIEDMNTTNPFERAARAEKVTKLLNFVPFAANAAETQAMGRVLETDDHVWALLLRAAAVKAASAETRRQVVACVKARRDAVNVLGQMVAL